MSTKKLLLMVFLAVYVVSQAFADNTGKNRKMDFKNDDEFLTYIQRQYFKYIWDAALPSSGLSRVRMITDDPERDRNTITVGSSGFALAGILAGIERGFISRDEGLDRIERIAGFLERSDRYRGMWSHWINDTNGRTIPFANAASKDNGGDIVESSFMAEGIICARQYFAKGNKREKALAAKLDKLWKEMQWSWYLNGDNTLMWHWSPDYGWEKNFPLKGYNECLAPYILGVSSPTYPIPAEAYYEGWARRGAILSDATLYGISPIVTHNTGRQHVGPLFWSAFSYVGFDPRGIKDKLGINYWDVNVNHVKIQRAYCIENPKGFTHYGADCWGFSAGYSVKGYKAHNTKNDYGAITPSATVAAMPYAPEEVMQALKYFYFELGDSLWGPYGFYDAYIPASGSVINDYLGNNQCAVVCMIENHRSGLLWKLFMSAPEIKKGLKKLGFTKDVRKGNLIFREK